MWTGPTAAAVVFDGQGYVIVTANGWPGSGGTWNSPAHQFSGFAGPGGIVLCSAGSSDPAIMLRGSVPGGLPVGRRDAVDVEQEFSQHVARAAADLGMRAADGAQRLGVGGGARKLP